MEDKIFFDTFEIKPKWGTVCSCYDCQEFTKGKSSFFDTGLCCSCYHAYDGFIYPQITDNILSELIYIGSYKVESYMYNKEDLLKQFINDFKNKEDIKQKVQALFKEV